MSRPEKPIDWKLVDELLLSGCLGTEIAPHFDMHHDTFYRRVEEKYGVSFTAYSSKKKEQGESILRHVQYCKAIGKTDKGDNTLLIWLGKNRLSQRESPQEHAISPDTMSQFSTLMNQLDTLQSALKIEASSTNAEQKS